MLFYLSMIDDPTDKEKFSKLYYKYRQLMFKIANEIIKNPHETEDVLQEAFIKVTKNMKKIGDVNCHETRNFLVIIVRNTCLDYLKKQKRNANESLDDLVDTSDNAASSEELVDSQEAVEQLARTILELPEKYANVLYLKYDNELTNKEIGKLLNMSQDNVRQVLLRAKNMLEQELKRKGEWKY